MGNRYTKWKRLVAQKGGDLMPTCQSCGKKWTWRQTVNQLLVLSYGMTCPYCGDEQYENDSAIAKRIFLLFLSLLLLRVAEKLNLPGTILLIMIVSLLLIIVITYPMILKLSNDEEHSIAVARPWYLREKWVYAMCVIVPPIGFIHVLLNQSRWQRDQTFMYLGIAVIMAIFWVLNFSA
ncbi:TIGR04104 family putative zinc finger protein [Lentibacillus kimchii]|uniref:TIGR04104 family putative zinc finger protein n=1 Tax=Lentibacillus kimchii TaxID=1542911 RepID=A0ABW2V022_9BACI